MVGTLNNNNNGMFPYSVNYEVDKILIKTCMTSIYLLINESINAPETNTENSIKKSYKLQKSYKGFHYLSVNNLAPHQSRKTVIFFSFNLSGFSSFFIELIFHFIICFSIEKRVVEI